jgi:hypothetical protein
VEERVSLQLWHCQMQLQTLLVGWPFKFFLCNFLIFMVSNPSRKTTPLNSCRFPNKHGGTYMSIGFRWLIFQIFLV